MAQDKINAILKEREHILLNPILCINAVKLVTDAENEEMATSMLELHRGFGYNTDFKNHVEVKSTAHIEKLKLKVTDSVKKSKDAAIEGKTEDAIKEALTRKERIALGKGLISLENLPILKEKVEAKKVELAAIDIASIKEKEKKDLDEIDTIKGPEYKKEMVEKYQAYFKAVEFHEDAHLMLIAAEEDIECAKSMLTYIKVESNTKELFTTKDMDLKSKKILLKIPLKVLTESISNEVDPKSILKITKNGKDIKLLDLLNATGIKGILINEVSEKLNELEYFVKNESFHINLVTLLKIHKVNDIIDMLESYKNYTTENKVKLMTCVLNSQIFIPILKLCTVLGWSSEMLKSYLDNQVPGPYNEEYLEKSLYLKNLSFSPKNGKFNSWLDTIGRLKEKNYVNIGVDAWHDLWYPPLVGERKFDVSSTDGINESFYIHWHVGEPSSHFKARSAAVEKVNVDYNSAHKGIQNLTSKTPPEDEIAIMKQNLAARVAAGL